MRTFILLSNKGQTDAEWPLNGLPNAGRMDLVCRSITAAFWISDGLRQDVTLYVVLNGEPNPPVTLKFVGKEVRYLTPDERNIGSRIRKALKEEQTKEWRNDTMGLYSSKRSFEEVLNELKEPVYYLNKDGKQFDAKKHKGTFVLGDNKGYSEQDLALLKAKGTAISLGETEYLTSQCITMMNYFFD